MSTKKPNLSWLDVKTKLTDFDKAGLIGLLQNLYNANHATKDFLHTRLSLGADVLEPYKTHIKRWLWPNFANNQEYSIAEAKKSIASYKKAWYFRMFG